MKKEKVQGTRARYKGKVKEEGKEGRKTMQRGKRETVRPTNLLLQFV
jgi:hypothetical protein